jgi:hypothetical protein
VQNPDVIKAGEVLATLNDWRAITFLLVFVIVCFIVERGLSSRAMQKERERMWQVSEKFGDAAERLGEQLNDVVTELQVQRALNARLESFVERKEKPGR